MDQATAAAAAAAAAGDPTAHHQLTNGSIVDAKTGQTVLTAGSAAKSHFSSIGALHLTQEECNEILIKRAIAAGHHQTHTITTADGAHHHAASGGTPSKHLKSVFVTPSQPSQSSLQSTYPSTHFPKKKKKKSEMK